MGLNEIGQHVHKYRRKKKVSGPPMFGSVKDKEDTAQKMRKRRPRRERGHKATCETLMEVIS